MKAEDASWPLGLTRDPGNPKTIEKLRQLEGYDMGPIRKLLVRDGWDEKNTKEVELRTKRFLALVFLDPGEVHTPAYGGVDEFWHQMIVYTPWYHEFCHAVFGEYLHHIPDPELSESGAKDGGKRTAELRAYWFGEKTTEALLIPPPCRVPRNIPPDWAPAVGLRR